MDEGSFKPLDSTESLVMDKGSFKPLAGVSKPKSTMEQAKDMGLAVATTAARNIPGVKQLSAHVGSKAAMLKDLFNFDDPKDPRKEYQDRLSKQGDILEGIEKEAPVTSAVSDIAAQIPMFLSGEGALLKAIPALKGAVAAKNTAGVAEKLPLASKLMNLIKTGTVGGSVNTAIQQGNAPDLDRLSKDYVMGFGGNVAGSGIAKAAEKVAPTARSMGSRLYDTVLKRGVTTVRDELEKDAGTLGQQMYDRGAWGKLKTLLMGADDTIEKKGAERTAHFERYNTPKDVEFPKGATYVDSPTRSDIPKLGKQAEKYGTNPNLETFSKLDENDLGNFLEEALTNQSTLDDSLPLKNRALKGTELEGTKPVVVRENFAEGSNPAPISKAKEIAELENLKRQAMNRPSEQHLVPQIEERITKLKQGAEEYDIFGAEAAKEDINDKIFEAYAKDNNPISKEIDLAKARGLKAGIEAPFEGADGVNPVRDLNKEMSYQIKLRDALKDKRARTQQNLPSMVTADVSRPLDALRKLLQLDTVGGASFTAQGIKQGGRGLEGLLKGTSQAAKLTPLAVGAESRMPEPESKYDIPIEAAGNVAESRPSFRAQPGVDPSSLSSELAQELQAIIEETGVNPFLSGSGRTKERNAEVNGVANSKHIFNNGLSDAADFSLKNLSKEDLAKFMQAVQSSPMLKALIHDAGSGKHIHTEMR